jgi:hypothetical protein
MNTTRLETEASSACPRARMAAWLILGCLLHSAGAAQAQTKPAHQYLPPSGTYIADAFALREDGGQLAYVTTTGTKDIVLHLVDLAPEERHREVGGVPGRVQALHFLGPDRILVVTRSGAGQVLGTVVTGAGPEAARVGPADHIALGRFDGKPVVTAYTKPAGKTGEHQLAAFDVAGLQMVTSRKVAIDGQRRLEVGGEKVRLLWWGEDFTLAAVRHPGKHDQAQDLRLPDRFGRVDLLTGKLIDDADIDPAGFARLASIQRLYPGRTTFVHLDARSRKLLLVDGTRSQLLQPARSLGRYDPAAVGVQKLGPDDVLVSLTVDPLNREAAARKQRDRHEIELYSVNPATGAMNLRLTLDGENRPAVWRVGGDKLALLRKHRSFARGGVVLQVFPLPSAGAGRP